MISDAMTMSQPSHSDWIVRHRPRPSASLRLFGFSHAGGGPSLYRGWPERLPPEIELLAIQLPGRESRFREPAFTRMEALIQELSNAIMPWLDHPFAFFGHSMGSDVAFELARELRRRSAPLPMHLFVSARRAPHLPSAAPIHDLPHEAFVAELERLGGTPPEVLASAELLEIVLPILRADFAVLETHIHQEEPPLDCPITAFHGTDDPRGTDELMRPWQVHTRSTFRIHACSGGHFYLKDATARVIRHLVAEWAGASERSER